MPRQSPLVESLTDKLKAPVPEPVAKAALEAARPFGSAAVGILFYGSCLRTEDYVSGLLDVYVLVDSYAGAHPRRIAALANRILPPNVYYSECEVEGECIRSKVAVLSLEDFEARCAPECLNVSIWARFSQPSRIIWTVSEDVSARIAAAIGDAVKTMLIRARPVADGETAQALWTTALGLTYGSELRSESGSKPQELYRLNQDYYEWITPLALDELKGVPVGPAGKERWRWVRARLNGKAVSLLRLVKAAFTFDGGIDYLAWKIQRHSGVKITIKPWQRRHPIVAGLLLSLKLRWRGAFR